MDSASKSQEVRPEAQLAAGGLRLRPLGARDVTFLLRLFRDAVVRRYLGGPVPWAGIPKALRRHLKASQQTHLWCVCLSRQRLGLVYLAPTRDGETLELSFVFAHRSWGHGYATQACAAAISASRTKKIVAETQSANTASRHLLARLGFTETGKTARFGASQTQYVLKR